MQRLNSEPVFIKFESERGYNYAIFKVADRVVKVELRAVFANGDTAKDGWVLKMLSEDLYPSQMTTGSYGHPYED